MSPGVRPEKRAVFVVSPVICVVEGVVVLLSLMVLDTALGSGVYVTVIVPFAAMVADLTVMVRPGRMYWTVARSA